MLTLFLAIASLSGIAVSAVLLKRIRRLERSIGTLLEDAGLPELRRLKAELHQSSERFRGICENSGLGVVVIDQDGTFTYANDTYLAILGATLEEVRRGAWVEHIHPDDRARIQAYWEEARRTRQAHVIERRSLDADGAVRWAAVRATPIYGDDGDFRGFITTVEDITARKLAEDKLRTSEERYSKIFHLLPDVLTISDLETGRYVEINQNWEALSGHSRDAAIGRTSLELGIWFDDAERLQFVEALHTKGELRDHPVRFRHRSGHLIESEVSATSFDVAGTPHLILISHDVTARNALAAAQRQTESALRESEQKFARVFELLPDLVMISNAEDGTFVDMNRQWTPMTGWSHAEALGRTSLEIGLWAEPEDRRAIIRSIHLEGEVRLREITLRRKSGEPFLTEYSGRFFEVNGKRYLASVITDMSEQRRLELERKRAEQALEHQTAVLARLLDSTPDLVFFKDREGVYLGCNTEFCRFAGRPREAIVGFTDFDLFERPFAEFFRNHDRTVLERLQPCQNDEWVTYPDGRRILLDTLKAPLLDAGGQATGLLGVGRDVTALKAAREALRISEAKFSGAFHASLDYITISYLDSGEILEVNEAFEKMTGWTRAEVLGKTAVGLGLWASPDERRRAVEILRAQGYVRDFACRIGLRSGAQRECLLNASTIEVDDQTYLLGAVRDVTEQLETRRQIERMNETLELRVHQRTAELERSNRELADTLDALRVAQDELIRSEKLAALGSLVAGIAHELNTPIGNGVTVASTLSERTLEFADAVHEGSIKRSTLNDYVESARRASDLLLRNLGQAHELVTSFKRVAVDQASDQRRPFDLRTTLEELAATLSPMLRKTPYRMELDLADGLTLDSYPGPLGQVVTNLVTNALLHAFEGRATGCMRIAAHALDARQVEIVFSDDGIGIAEENLKRIFDPFFTTKLGKGGSGLGLNIVHNIVTGSLGGKLSVMSRTGEGTKFTLTIPFNAPRGDTESTA